MPANPFASPTLSTSSERPAVPQPYAFGAMGALVFLLTWLINNLIAAVHQPDLFAELLDYLPRLLPNWLFAALLNCLACLLLASGYMARHAIVFHHPRRLLLGIGSAMLLANLLYGALSGFLLDGIYQWLDAHSDMLPIYQPLVFETLGVLAFAITALLPLWAGLHLGKRQTAPTASPLPRQEAPLLLALCFILLSLKLILLLPEHLLGHYEWSLELALLYLSLLLCGSIIFAAAWHALPARQKQLRPGQLVLTALTIFLVWMLALLLGAILLVLSAFSGNDALLQPLPLTIVGVAVLALLWPLTLLGLRWIYRAEAA